MPLTIQSVRSDDGTMLRSIDGAFTPNILLSLIIEQDTNSIYRIGTEVQIKETETTVWRSGFLFGGSATSIRIKDIEVGSTYNIRARHVYSNGTIDTWTEQWSEIDEFGTPTGVMTSSHTVEGNKRIPPDCDGLTIVNTITNNLLFNITTPWFPLDFANYEIRYYLGKQADFPGGVYDWSIMSPLIIASSGSVESSALATGEYTFAAKIRSYARDPSGDNITTFPSYYTESANAFFVEYTVVDPRPIEVLFYGATAPTSISGTVIALTNWSASGISDNATIIGIILDPVAGTITMPALPAQIMAKISAQINLDISVAGSPANDTDIGVFLMSNINGNNYLSGSYIVDKNKQSTLPITVNGTILIESSEILQIGIATIGGGSGNIGFEGAELTIEFIPYY